MSCNIYYPDDLLPLYRGKEETLVIGHRDGSGNYVVITTVPRDTSYQTCQKEIMQVDGIGLYVIGTTNFSADGLFEFAMAENGYPVVKADEYINLVLFKSPNSVHMEFYSLHSILIQPLPQHTLSQKLGYHLNCNYNITDMDSNFEHALFVVNSIDYLRYKFLKLDDRAIKANRIWDLFSWLITFLLSTLGVFSDVALMISQMQIIPNAPLTRVSDVFHQLGIRLAALRRLPSQFHKIEQKTISLQIKPSLPNYSASLEYIRFYNLLYIILVDMFLGNVLRNFLLQHTDLIKWWFQYMKEGLLHHELFLLIQWLTDNPGGFKLNSELSNFIGDLYLWALKFWYDQVVNKFLLWDADWTIWLVAQLSKPFGATIILAAVCDVVAFLRLHVVSFNVSMTKIYNWQLNILLSLFRLFLGKKYNVLRRRIDSQAYDLDQLFLGIIIFTVLIYLLPTILAFYLTFYLLNLAFYVVYFMLNLAILFLNQLPIFIFLISLKNPKRLSDGLTVDVINVSEGQVVLRMKSKSLSFFKLLKYYWHLANQNVDLVTPKSVLANLIKGEMPSQMNYEQIYRNFQDI